jgi:hypothetical protein
MNDPHVVEAKIKEALKGADNITFLLISPDACDDIISGYNVCLKTGKIFVADIGAAFFCDKLRKKRKDIPVFHEKTLRIKFFRKDVEALTKAGYRDLLYFYGKRKIDSFEINRKKNKILMCARDGSFPLAAKEIDDIRGARFIAPQGPEQLSETLRQYCDLKGIVVG